MPPIAPDGDLATWIELHGPLTPVDALVLLNQICAELEQLATTGLLHHNLVPATVLLRSEEDGLVPLLHDVSPPTQTDPPGLDSLLWTMLSGLPAPDEGLPRLSGHDDLSAGFNTLFDLLAAHGSRTTGLHQIRTALVRLANRARSTQTFTPIPVTAQDAVTTPSSATEPQLVETGPGVPLPRTTPGRRGMTGVVLLAALAALAALAVAVVVALSR